MNEIIKGAIGDKARVVWEAEETADAALKQIEERRYGAELEAKGLDGRVDYRIEKKALFKLRQKFSQE